MHNSRGLLGLNGTERTGNSLTDYGHLLIIPFRNLQIASLLGSYTQIDTKSHVMLLEIMLLWYPIQRKFFREY